MARFAIKDRLEESPRDPTGWRTGEAWASSPFGCRFLESS
jgi:hypothetical protein